MISHLKGTLSQKSPVSIVVDVNGVGYQVFTSLTTFYALPEPGKAVFLKIHTHVRENSLIHLLLRWNFPHNFHDTSK